MTVKPYGKLRSSDLNARFNKDARKMILDAMKYRGVVGRVAKSGHCILAGPGGRNTTIPPELSQSNRGLQNARSDMRRFLDGLPLDELEVKTPKPKTVKTSVPKTPARTAVGQALQRAADRAEKPDPQDRAAEAPEGARSPGKDQEGTEKTKQCFACKLVKPVDAFGVKRANPDGLQSSCKICVNKQQLASKRRREERLDAATEARAESTATSKPEGDWTWGRNELDEDGSPPPPEDDWEPPGELSDAVKRTLEDLDHDVNAISALQDSLLPDAPDPGPNDLPEPSAEELLIKVKLLLWTPAERRRIAALETEIQQLRDKVEEANAERDEYKAEAERLQDTINALAALAKD